MTTRRAPSKIIPRAFPGIKPNEIEELIANSQVHSYAPGSILCRENAVEDRFYMILEGEVEVTKIINNVETRRLNLLGPGDFFGEMALIHNAPRAATVTAKSPLTALELDKAGFDRVLRNSTSIAIAMISEISDRLRENDQMAVDDIRLRLWAVLAAAGGITLDERRAFLQRFRLRRAIDICSGVAADLAGGRISRGHPELSTLREASTRVVEHIDDGRPAQSR